MVNGFQPLTIITKRSILDVAAALDPSLKGLPIFTALSVVFTQSLILPLEEMSDHLLSGISDLFDQVVLLLGQAINSCSHKMRFNILLTFLNDNKKSNVMSIEYRVTLADTNNILFSQNMWLN